MAQTQALVATLKKAIKAQGLAYKDVARELQMSESSVKRIFAEENFSLARLEHICHWLGLELSDLMRRMEAETRQVTELTEAQEQELVSDPRLLLVAHLVVNGWRYQDILARYEYSEAELVRYLVRLDKLKLLELQSNNRIRLLLSPHFMLRRNGPIQRFLTSRLHDDFLNSSFKHRGESFLLLSGTLTMESRVALIKKMERLAQEFNEFNQDDHSAPLEQRTGCSMFLAIRPWRPDVYEKMRRYPASSGQPSRNDSTPEVDQ